MQENPDQSFENQLKMARPRRSEVKRVPLTPEEKELLGEIMDKAVAAEKAGDLQQALHFYTDYKNELIKIKEKKEEKKEKKSLGKEWTRDDVIEWAEDNIVKQRPEDAPDWVDQNFEFDELPKIKKKSDLILGKGNLETLPNNLDVEGSLTLIETTIKKMPEVLTVGNHLTLRGSKIDVLPTKLCVFGALDLANITIDDNQIPDDIFVGGDVYIIKDADIQIKNQLHKLKEQGKIKGAILTD